MSRPDLENHELALLRVHAGEMHDFIVIERSALTTAVFEYLRKSGYIEEDGFLTDLGVAALLSPRAKELLRVALRNDFWRCGLLDASTDEELQWAGCWVADDGPAGFRVHHITERGCAVARILAEEGSLT